MSRPLRSTPTPSEQVLRSYYGPVRQRAPRPVLSAYGFCLGTLPLATFRAWVGREDDDESGRGARDLELAATEHRDDGSCDDRRVEAMLRRNTDGDRQRHRQRQGDDAHHDAREQIRAKLR